MSKYKMPSSSIINEIVNNRAVETWAPAGNIKATQLTEKIPTPHFTWEDQEQLFECIKSELYCKPATSVFKGFIEGICLHYLHEIAHEKGFDVNDYILVGAFILHKSIQEKYQVYGYNEFDGSTCNFKIGSHLPDMDVYVPDLYKQIIPDVNFKLTVDYLTKFKK